MNKCSSYALRYVHGGEAAPSVEDSVSLPVAAVLLSALSVPSRVSGAVGADAGRMGGVSSRLGGESVADPGAAAATVAGCTGVEA